MLQHDYPAGIILHPRPNWCCLGIKRIMQSLHSFTRDEFRKLLLLKYWIAINMSENMTHCKDQYWALLQHLEKSSWPLNSLCPPPNKNCHSHTSRQKISVNVKKSNNLRLPFGQLLTGNFVVLIQFFVAQGNQPMELVRPGAHNAQQGARWDRD